MSEAERVCAVTRRMHIIASRADCAMITLSKIARLAEQELAVVVPSTHGAGEEADGVAGAQHFSVRR
jgi:ribosomal protein L18E